MILDVFEKKFGFLAHNDFFVYDLSEVKLLVSSTNLGYRYLTLPVFVTLSRNSSGITLVLDDSVEMSVRSSIEFKIEKWLKSVAKFRRNKLILKGLGYKANLLLGKSLLNLKLGYSHVLALQIPVDRIRVKVFKNVITVKGYDLIEIGNFARKIRRLRAPDAYKGKGVWLKNERKTLKELRKK